MSTQTSIIFFVFIVCVVGEYINYNEHTWRCLNTTTSRFLYMRLADNVDGVKSFDLWFDRLVSIHHTGEYDVKNKIKNPIIEDMSLTIPAVIISKKHVLTSLNAFRDIIRFRFKRHFTNVCVVSSRGYRSFERNINAYYIHQYRIDCARPVIPLRDEEIPINLWHGYEHYEKMHSPLHDLLVLRIDMEFVDILPDNPYTEPSVWREDPNDRTKMHHVGPIITKVADESDILGRRMKFGMAGMKSGKPNRDLYIREYEADDNVQTDCDEWIPREWGWFICLRNLDKIKRFAQGAMLYSDKKLFGVGSFSLFKGEQSVLVFTDIRKYHALIYNTCTEEDQDFKEPRTDL